MSGAFLVEEERVYNDDDPAFMQRTCSSVSEGNTASEAPAPQSVDAPMSTPTRQQANAQQKAVRDTVQAPDQKSIQCDSALRTKEVNAQLHGTDKASKLVFFGAKMTMAELNASHAMEFDQGTLDSIWKVHGRNEESRGRRVGDPSSVMITEAALVQTYSTSDIPVFLECSQMGGKIYPCLSNTGRKDGRAHRKLAVIGRGTKQYGANNIVYRKVRVQLTQMSRVTGSYNADNLTADCKEIAPAGYEPSTLVPETNYISQFINAHATRWRLIMSRFSKVHGYVLYPKSLVDFVVKLLKEMHAHVANQKHNLRALKFTVQSVCANGTPAASLMSGNDSVYVGFAMLIKYTFLDEKSLTHTG